MLFQLLRQAVAFCARVALETQRPELFRVTCASDHHKGVAQDTSGAHTLRPQGFAHATESEAVADLAAGLSHDYGNLLSVITGNLDLVDRRGIAKEFRPLIDDVRAASERMNELNQMLRMIGRANDGNVEPVSVNDVLATLEAPLRRELPATISIECLSSEAPGTIEADPEFVRAALTRLVSNARDAMPAGGRLRIETAICKIDDTQSDVRNNTIKKGGYVAVSVIDTGRGMMPEVMARAFDPYFTTHYRGEGSGLGLSVVEGIVKRAGGAVQAKSQTGKGTTVTLLFPAAKQPRKTGVIGLPRSDALGAEAGSSRR